MPTSQQAYVFETIAIIGLGYVGLPLALAMAKVHPRVVGFDINPRRVATLSASSDAQIATALAAETLQFTSDTAHMVGASAFIIAVPTPITASRSPDLASLTAASKAVAAGLTVGSLVVVESTVAPGTTLDFVLPLLAKGSGLKPHIDFHIAFSPERINPGDAAHALDRVPKVVSAATPEGLALVRALYGPAVGAGLVVAPSIAAAELAKLVENTQRDINIALMNEVAIICDRLGLRTADVLAVAKTKWNFLPFEPGLVGGHCISVDPWYLADRAESLGLHPDVVVAGRRTNDSMAAFVAQKTLKLIAAAPGPRTKRARVGVFGVTFKENFPDIRNSQVLVLCAELQAFGVELFVVDPVADPEHVRDELGLELWPTHAATELDALILAVRHDAFVDEPSLLMRHLRPGGVLVDVKSALSPAAVPPGLRYWSL